MGHLGGWVEGAAMSAINAVVGVCSPPEQREPGTSSSWRTGSATLLEADVRHFHHWRISADGRRRKAGLSSTMRVGNWRPTRPLPPRWRYLGKTSSQALRPGHRVEAGRLHGRRTQREALLSTPGTLTADSGGPSAVIAGTEGIALLPEHRGRIREGAPSRSRLFFVGNHDLDRARPPSPHRHTVESDFVRPWRGQVNMAEHRGARPGGRQRPGAGRSTTATASRTASGLGTRRARSVLRFPPSPGGVPGARSSSQEAAASCTGPSPDLTTDRRDRPDDGRSSTSRSATVSAIDGGNGSSCPHPGLPTRRGTAPGTSRSASWCTTMRTMRRSGHCSPMAARGRTSCTPRLATPQDPSGLWWTKFQPVPYPLSGAAGPVVDFAPTLPYDSRHLDPDAARLSTVVFAQIGANGDAEEADEDEVPRHREGWGIRPKRCTCPRRRTPFRAREDLIRRCPASIGERARVEAARRAAACLR